MNIRSYESRDHEAVLDLQTDGFGPDNPYQGDLSDLSAIECVYLVGGVFLVAIVNDGGRNRIVAIGALQRVTDTLAHVKRMRTHSLFRGKGYAQAILTALEQKAKEFGYKKLQLTTGSRLVAARHLYQKNGYHVVARRNMEGQIWKVITYEKDI